MSAKFRSIEGDTFGIIDISSYSVYTESSGLCQLHPEAAYPTILDLVNYANDLRTHQKFLPASFNTLTTPMTEQQSLSTEINDILDVIDSVVYWFWGSAKKGGVGLGYGRNGKMAIVTSYGRCVDGNDNYIWGLYQMPLQQSYDANTIGYTLSSCFFAYQYGFVQGTKDLKPTYELLVPNPDRGNCFFFVSKIYSPTSYYVEWLEPDLTHPNFRMVMVGNVESYAQCLSTAAAGWGIGTYDDGGVLINFQTIYYPKYVIYMPRFGQMDIPIYELPPVGYSSLDGANIWGGGEIPQQPNTNGGTSGGGGGGGGFENDTDNNDFTDPTNWIDATDTGFITLYNPTKSQLRDLATFLFTGITASAEITLKKLLANPMDYLVSLNMVHLPLSFTETEAVSFGGLSTGVSMGKLSKQFLSIYGGYFNINEQFRTFLDYGKYSTIKISIPYCGVFPLPTDALMGGTLHINYIVDLLTGSMTAELKIHRQRSYVDKEQDTERVIATYSGNCFLPLPIASSDYRQTISSLLGITGGLATSVATGSPLPLIGSSANAVTNSKQDINVGGNIGNNYGYMTQQKAFLILERPCQNLPLNYPKYYGYPSNVRFRQLALMRRDLGDGYIEIDNSKYWVGSVTNGFGSITNEESKELEQIVENGIWI